jgi:regulator of sigma D
MKILRLLGASALVGILLSASATQSQGAVHVGDTLYFAGGDLGSPGGRFHVTDLTNSETFDTFCVELFEHIGYGGTYVVDGLTTATVSSNQALTPFVAWLYDSFVNHTLNNFSYSSATDANILQYDIWTHLNPAYTDAQIGSVGGQTFAGNAKLIGWMNDYTSSGWGSTLGDVLIINLGNVGDHGAANAQDQLVLVQRPHDAPLPEPASIVVWSLLGCATIVGLRRRSASR